jgi:hypothetical protein
MSNGESRTWVRIDATEELVGGYIVHMHVPQGGPSK